MINKIKRLIHTAFIFLTTKTISDDYINWLTAANSGWLDKGNIYSLDVAIRNLPTDSPILEIGSFCGLSTNVINYFLSIYGKKNKIITCDKWIFGFPNNLENPGKLGKSQISHQEYCDFTRTTFKRNVEFFSRNNKPYTISLISDDFFALREKSAKTYDIFDREIKLGGKISFCYVDGNHSYEFVKRDFDHINQYLELGGYILFVNSICKCNSIRWHERQAAVASLPFVPARKRGTDETLHTAYRASTLPDLRPDESRTYTNGDSRLDRRA